MVNEKERQKKIEYCPKCNSKKIMKSDSRHIGLGFELRCFECNNYWIKKEA